MNLSRDKWEKIYLGNIVSELRITSKNPIEDGYDKYIGFEHIESENIYIKDYGKLSDGVTFKKTFKTNDVLFGKIRAYLKKVAVAPFDGICSGDILVLRTKNENKLNQKIIPYLLTTQTFLKRAIDSSIGTTLPRTKWEHLNKHEVLLPSIKEQNIIISLFNAFEKSTTQIEKQERNLKLLRYKLINKLSKQKPILGNLINLLKCKICKIDDVAKEINDRIENPFKLGYEKFIGLESFESGELIISNYLSTEKLVSTMKLCKKGDVLFARRNAYLKRTSITDSDAVCSGDVIVIRVENKIILPEYLILVMNTDEFWEYAISNAAGTMSKRVKWRDLAKYTFDLPDLETQKKILEIFNEIEKNIKLLIEQKASLNNLKQKLLNEIFG